MVSIENLNTNSGRLGSPQYTMDLFQRALHSFCRRLGGMNEFIQVSMGGLKPLVYSQLLKKNMTS